MKALATIKPVSYLKNTENYAYLIEIDFLSGLIERKLKLPSASFRSENSFMTNFAQGLVAHENKVYVAYWNFIVVIDYVSFCVIDVFSHPLMTDNHGIDTDGKRLFVTSTAIDMLLIFDLQSKRLLDHWGADASFFNKNVVFVPTWLHRGFLGVTWNKIAQKTNLFKVRSRFSSEQEYRATHKSNSLFHNHHLNDVLHVDENEVILTTKGWNDFENGSVISLDLVSKEARFIAPPGSFKGLHDCLKKDDTIYVTESSKNSIGMITADGNIHHKVLTEVPYFVRGLAETNQGFLLGYSSLRGKDAAAAKIVHYDSLFEKEYHSISLENLYVDSKVAVHAIVLSPSL